MQFRWFTAATLACVLAPLALAQEGPMSKEEEQKKFHPTPVVGTAAAQREAAWNKRRQLMAASPFGQLKWRNVGPENQSGRVLAIDSPLDRPEDIYVAFATGGLHRTSDDGITWESLFDQESAFGIGDFVVSADGKTIYVGSGEANSQRTSYAGTGVFKSTDSGKTWVNVGLPESHHIGRLAMDPKNPQVVYVAALGHLYSQNRERGVYKTTDGGKTWTASLQVDEYTGAVDIVMDPRNPQILYAAMWDRDRRAWNFRESGKGSAVYKTTNGGRTWTKISSLPMGYAAGRIGLTIAHSNPNVVYAFVDNQSEDEDWAYRDEFTPSGRLTPRRFSLLTAEQFTGLDAEVLATFFRTYARDLKPADLVAQVKDKKLTMEQVRAQVTKASPNAFNPGIVDAEIYRTGDAGKSWKRIRQMGEHGGYYWGKVVVNPKDENDVWTMGVLMLRSRDGGSSWTSVAQTAHVDHHVVFFDHRSPKKIWIGNDGGTYLSGDDGKTWRHLNNLSVGQTTTLALDNKTPYNIYTGLQDNGTMKGPSTYVPGRSDLGLWTDIGGGDGSNIAVDPRDGGDIVYIASQFGAHFTRNQKTGESWSSRANEPAIRYNWISPLIISPHHPDIVYLGSQKLHRSFNQGRRYEAISPDLTKNRPNGDVPHSTIKDISESPFKFGLIYVGTDDGNVKMTPDGGNTWVDIATPAPDKWVSRVVASKYAVGTVYVAQTGYREDDFTAYLWRSTDYGKTWQSIVGNLPAESINVIREDPARKDILYVGTDMGVYVTFDGGVTWESLHGGMPTAPIHDMAIQARENDLVVASHSRGIWILPLKTVHSLTPEIRAKDLSILSVATLVRSSTWGYERRQPWNLTPAASPKLRGQLFAKTGGAAKIRLKDKDGKVVKEADWTAGRGFNDFEIDLLLTPAKLGTVDPKAKPPTNPLADPYADERATFLPEGEYTLEIEVAGKTVSQPWKLG